MKLLFVHPIFSVFGGAEKVILDLYKLCSKDYKSEMFTIFDAKEIKHLNNVNGKFTSNISLSSILGYKFNPFINNYIKQLGKIFALKYEKGDKIILSNFPASLVFYEACKINKNIEKEDVYWLCFEPDRILYYDKQVKLGYMPPDVKSWKFSLITKFLSGWRKKDMSVIRKIKTLNFSKYVEGIVRDIYGKVNAKSNLKLYVDTKGWVILDKKSAIDVLNNKLNLDLNYDDFIILAISRLEYSKGLHELIKVLDKLRKKKKFVCLIGGRGNLYNYLEKEANKNRDIKLLGFVPDELLSSLYSASDVFTFLGKYETGGPLTILESMYSDCITIASNEGGPAEKIQDKEDGFLVDVNDTDEIVKLICSLYDMDTTKILHKAKDKVSKQYTIENFYNLFKKALSID